MGLNCSHGAWDGAYSAFHRWRSKIAEVAGMPPLELMEGFYASFEKDKIGYIGTPTLYVGKVDEIWEDKLKRLDAQLPIKWDSLKKSPLHFLLYHSDCDGHIPWSKCRRIADALEELIPLLPDEEAGGHIGNWREKTKTFVTGLRAAYAGKQRLRFG
jgi:hypothetical protein